MKIYFLCSVLFSFLKLPAQRVCRPEQTAFNFFVDSILIDKGYYNKSTFFFVGNITNKYSTLQNKNCFSDDKEFYKQLIIAAHEAEKNTDSAINNNSIEIVTSKRRFKSTPNKRSLTLKIFQATTLKKLQYVQIEVLTRNGQTNFVFEVNGVNVRRWCMENSIF